MSLDQDVKQTVAVTDLAIELMRAKDFDRANICSGLAIIASLLARSDPEARAMLACTFLKLARQLDPELVNARWQ
jgi:hypothetical protein